MAAVIVGLSTAPSAEAQGWSNLNGNNFLHGAINSGVGQQYLNGFRNGNFGNNFASPYARNFNRMNVSSFGNSCGNNFNSGWSNSNSRKQIRNRIKQINKLVQQGRISPQQAMAMSAQLQAELSRYRGGIYGNANYNPYGNYNNYAGVGFNNNFDFGQYNDPNFLSYLNNSNPTLMTQFLSFLGI